VKRSRVAAKHSHVQMKTTRKALVLAMYKAFLNMIFISESSFAASLALPHFEQN
jgi:hypothetical protein